MSILSQILKQMNERGQFRVAVLATSDGLPVATVSTPDDTEAAAAMAAVLQRVAKQARGPLGMAEVEELVLQSRDRTRMVCRYFQVGNEELILAVMVDPGAYYRSATSRAMREIETIWNTEAKGHP
jgi:predicted regulator of Ras-like GTPase activity (Roadblock/LC7/MglB family)